MLPLATLAHSPKAITTTTTHPPLNDPQSFTQRTSTDQPPRERFLSVSSEILPDLLVQVIVSVPLRESSWIAIWHSSEEPPSHSLLMVPETTTPRSAFKAKTAKQHPHNSSLLFSLLPAVQMQHCP